MQGRFGGNVSDQRGIGSPPLVFSWPASSVYASFQGSSVNATISALEPVGAISSQYSHFVFFLDQQQEALEITTPNNTVINWGAVNIANGIHNLTITKISEASYGQATLDSLTVGPGGRYCMHMIHTIGTGMAYHLSVPLMPVQTMAIHGHFTQAHHNCRCRVS